MRILFVLNEAPYGSERSFNGLRLADALVGRKDCDFVVFLMGDAVACAKSGQRTPVGYYNVERMLKPLTCKGRVLLCGTCMDARGLSEVDMAAGTLRASMNELKEETSAADKVIVFLDESSWRPCPCAPHIVYQHWVDESELSHGGSDLSHLFFQVGDGVARIGHQPVQRPVDHLQVLGRG